MKLYLSVLFALSLLSACSHSIDEGPAKVEQNYQYTFTSVGYASIEAQSGESFDQKILKAIKASKLEAYKEMAEQIYGVLITAVDSAESSVLLGDRVESQVKGLVRGARVLKSYHEGGIYITELELDMQTLPFLRGAEFTQQGGKVIKVEEAVYY
ncbi:MAG: flagellar biosynthesis protein FlgP [Psychromonas sp.]|nr:flagellar biosynthesis protein FlgP [Alteromonadales bacterium]MCP5076788.1 flagellar biosynthesis protein FlgP [Psychromonas sp.]